MKKNQQPKSYTIKVPVYASELIEKVELFKNGDGIVTYPNMINLIKNKIDNYENQKERIKSDKRNKTVEKNIKEIKYTEHTIGDIPTLLVRISAYNTNFLDGYYESKEKKAFTKDDKIGSDTNYFLMYPHIYGIDHSSYRYQWLILIYEDPNKDGTDLIKTVKMVLEKVLEIKTANVKLKVILETLSKYKKLDSLSIKLTSISYEKNGMYSKYSQYLTNSKLKKDKEDTFENMPIDEVKEIIEDKEYLKEGYTTKTSRLRKGRKEFVLQDILSFFKKNSTSDDLTNSGISPDLISEASEKMTQVAEEIYNASTEINQEDLENRIYDTKFIVEKLEPIIQNYLSTTDE